MALVSTCSDPKQSTRSDNGAAEVTVFVCANSARPPQRPDCGIQLRPVTPEFRWPFPVREILVSCTGRIQPEHVLKVFELGGTLVCAIACDEDNCHYLEGSKRCARRVDYLRTLLDEVGLGSERLMLFHLCGTAAEDMALGAGVAADVRLPQAQHDRIAAIRDAVVQALDSLPPNPLYSGSMAEEAEETYNEVDDSNDHNQD